MNRGSSMLFFGFLMIILIFSYKHMSMLQNNQQIVKDESNGIQKVIVDVDGQKILCFDENTPTKVDSENPRIHVEVPLEELVKGPYVLTQDNPQLIEHIQQNLSPPSKKSYNLTGVHKRYPSHGQFEQIKNILGEMRNGFFVECGALDGEQSSNTLEFERQYGWRGLLMEAKPSTYDKLMFKQRKAWAIHACISRKPYPNSVLFPRAGNYGRGKISDLPVSSKIKGYAEVQCLPLYSLLIALNTTTVDYFSLDVEGHEIDVLKTIPWDKVNIRTLSVEHINIKVGRKPLHEYMMSQGYYIYNPDSVKGDTIFMRKDVIPKIRAPYL